MCRRVAEGIRFKGCGHFTRMAVAAIVDCENTYCKKSIRHYPNCNACKTNYCIDYWGPDVQKVISASDDVCSGCKFQPGTHKRTTQS